MCAKGMGECPIVSVIGPCALDHRTAFGRPRYIFFIMLHSYDCAQIIMQRNAYHIHTDNDTHICMDIMSSLDIMFIGFDNNCDTSV